ncbi:composite domain of metallo-dependent hydrolase [Gigaspora margarita]|uniref:Composite domain of metallo-dependent hydrolase n=1 Tax=Gigaspora margarita TaxID=4874 RepID=A0A8H4B4J5_GIGMA|nr:composite domain of metallo-dependent hydrolase [Gigaspora margarita]
MPENLKDYIQINGYTGNFNPSISSFHVLRSKKLFLTILLCGLFTTLFMLYDIHSTPYKYKFVQHSVGISKESYIDGVNKCNVIKRAKPDNKFIRTSNPRFVPGTKTIILKNGKILNEKGEFILGDIVLKNGLIHDFGTNLIDEEDAVIIDVKKKYITPGLVDMHSHVGVGSMPSFIASYDSNEITNPIRSYLRAQDAINPSDLAIRIIASGGITTSLVLPGSSNLMGGEGFAIKMRPVDTLSVDDMGINANIDPEKERAWRWLKMACGENPKRNYGPIGRIPSTRMGEAWLFRKLFAEAQELKQKQDDWCEAAETLSSEEQLNSYFPEELQLESLVALLRGDAKLNVHCYETHDIEAMIRHSLEFNFNITAFHHALDAYRITEIIKNRVKNNITIATFSDYWGYKKEAFQASTKSPKILADAHIPVALKSDHPVTNAQTLMYEASKANYYGLDEHLSLAAVTSVPAKALGLDHRIGKISKGYDADVVVWDSHPLTLGATPLEVYIDGIPQFNTSSSILENEISKQIPSNNINTSIPKSNFTRKPIKSRLTSSLVLKNIGKIYVDKNNIIDNTSSTQGDISVIVKDGIVECIGINYTEPDQISSYEVIDLNGGYILPGFVAVAPSLGLSEIIKESSTTDGFVTPVSNPNNAEGLIYAIDGLKLGGKHLEAAYKGGVFTAVTAPLSFQGVFVGVSMAFETGASSVLDYPEPIVKEHVALHANVGAEFKYSTIPTVSGQIALIRKTLIKNLWQDNIFGCAARGQIPFIVQTHNKDEIASLIRLKIQVRKNGGNLNLVILGGTEAHMHAAELAKYKISVILIPPRPLPKWWNIRHALTGALITNTTGIGILYANKVMVGIGVQISGYERNLIWDAGWAAINSKGIISEKDSLGFISWNLEEILGLDRRDRKLMKGNIANFVAYDGNPFDMSTRVKVIAGGGKNEILIDPQQD